MWRLASRATRTRTRCIAHKPAIPRLGGAAHARISGPRRGRKGCQVLGERTNENTNRLIRRYLPAGTPITSHQPYLDTIAYEPDNCPRATLGYRTPTEAFNELIATTH